MGAFSGPRLPKRDQLVFYIDPSRDAQKGHGGDGTLGQVQVMDSGSDASAPYPIQRHTSSVMQSGKHIGQTGSYLYDRSGNNNHAIFWDYTNFFTSASIKQSNMRWISSSISGSGYYVRQDVNGSDLGGPAGQFVFLEYESSSLNKGNWCNSNVNSNYFMGTASAHSDMKYASGKYQINSQSNHQSQSDDFPLHGAVTMVGWAYYERQCDTATLFDKGNLSNGQRDCYAHKHWLGTFTHMRRADSPDNASGDGWSQYGGHPGDKGFATTGSHPDLNSGAGEAWKCIVVTKGGLSGGTHVLKSYVNGTKYGQSTMGTGIRPGTVMWMKSFTGGETLGNHAMYGPFMMFYHEWTEEDVKQYYEDNKDRFAYHGDDYGLPGSDI